MVLNKKHLVDIPKVPLSPQSAVSATRPCPPLDPEFLTFPSLNHQNGLAHMSKTTKEDKIL